MIKYYSALEALDWDDGPCDYQQIGPDFKTYKEALDYIKEFRMDWDTLDEFKIRCTVSFDYYIPEEESGYFICPDCNDVDGFLDEITRYNEDMGLYDQALERHNKKINAEVYKTLTGYKED